MAPAYEARGPRRRRYRPGDADVCGGCPLPIRIAALVALALVLVACGSDQLDVHDVEAAEPPPRDAELVDADWPQAAAWIRREVDDGRPVVMNVFASWCAPCERELPVLNEAMADNPGIAFLGIDHMDLRENAEAFVGEQDIDFPTLFDIDGAVAAAVGGRAMPTTAFFDRDGQLVALASGELSEAALEEHLNRIR